MADTVPPKHPSQRRRRNKPPVPPKTLSKDARKKAKVPPLPGDGWNTFARDYWRLIWTSPMATQYLEVDKPALIRLTQLANRVGEGTIGVAALGEMRQLEDRFGLSPLSRRRLQIDIVDEPGNEKGDDGPKQDERWLRVVGDDE